MPNPSKLPSEEILISKNKITRNLKLKSFFMKKDTKVGSSQDRTFGQHKKKLEHPSGWEPPFHLLHDDVKETVEKINIETNNLLRQLPATPDGSIYLRGKSNLTTEERASLKNLKNNDEIVIKKADKGSAVVVLDRQAYINEAHRQLQNKKYYKQLSEPVYPQMIDKINNVLCSLLAKRAITKKQFDYLRADSSTCRNRIFYLLPKIHKPVDSWPQTGMPEGRPIVSDCSSESNRVSEYIDRFLTPLSNKHSSYVKNTYDFLEKVRDTSVNRNCLLVTGDVSALYTNMNLDRVLEVVREAFDRYPDVNRPSSDLLELLELILKNNDFEFDEQFYLQIHGVGMGKRFAPSLANLYLIAFDELAKNGFKIKPELFYRFLDDLFFLFNGTVEEVREFEHFLNGLIPDIKVTLTCHDTHISFLDTVIYKLMVNGDDGDAVLKSRVYFKPTDTHQLLHTQSFHPKHTFQGVLRSQLIRFKRISSSFEDYESACRVLFLSLQKRGYCKRLLRKLKKTIWLNHTDTAKPAGVVDGKFIPLIVQFNHVSQKFVKIWKDTIVENNRFQDFKLVAAYKRNKNLASFLTSSKLRNHAQTDEHINENGAELSGAPSNHGFSLCNGSRCLACRLHVKPQDTFVSNTYGSSFHIRISLNCRTTNVVYLITCSRCNKQYVGETGRCLGDRLTDHRSNIKAKKLTPIALHFNEPEHSFNDLTAVAIEKIENAPNALLRRRQREKFWQLKLGTIFPNGLNNNPTLCKK